MAHACFTGLPLVAFVQRQNEIVGRIFERQQADVRLHCEARASVKRGDLLGRERSMLGVVESLDEGPLDARYIDRQCDGAGQ